MGCDHSGTYSGASRYLRDAHQLRLLLVCDRCGAERAELTRFTYSPDACLSGGQPATTSPTAGGTVVHKCTDV